MLRLQDDSTTLVRLIRTNLELTDAPAPSEICRLVLNNAEAVVEEIGSDLVLLDGDASGHVGQSPQFDLVCVRHDGTIAVLVPPVPGDQQVSIALSTAAKVSQWTLEELASRISDEHLSKLEAVSPQIREKLNQHQEIVLIDIGKNPDLAATVGWLSASGVNISTLRLEAYMDPRTHETFLVLPNAENSGDGLFIMREQTTSQELQPKPDLDRELAALMGRLENEERGRYLLEQRYRTVSRLAPIGIFHTDPDGEYLFVNPRWCEITGLTPQEASGEGWTRALHPDDRQRVLSAWSDAILSKKPFKSEIRFQRSDGTSWVIAEADVQLDSSGALVGTAGTLTEIHRDETDSRQEHETESSTMAPTDPEYSVL